MVLSVFKMYADGFFFEAAGSRVLEVFQLEPVFVAMRAFDNLTKCGQVLVVLAACSCNQALVNLH